MNSHHRHSRAASPVLWYSWSGISHEMMLEMRPKAIYGNTKSMTRKNSGNNSNSKHWLHPFISIYNKVFYPHTKHPLCECSDRKALVELCVVVVVVDVFFFCSSANLQSITCMVVLGGSYLPLLLLSVCVPLYTFTQHTNIRNPISQQQHHHG